MKKKKPMTRSQNMARVKSKNTKPEIFLRKLLWHKGFRYRVNYKELPGSPDSSIPKSNFEFRKNKLEGNVKKDKKNYAQLESMGIKVIVVWGCEIKQMMKDECVLSKKMNSIYQTIIYNHNREVE